MLHICRVTNILFKEA